MIYFNEINSDHFLHCVAGNSLGCIVCISVEPEHPISLRVDVLVRTRALKQNHWPIPELILAAKTEVNMMVIRETIRNYTF